MIKITSNEFLKVLDGNILESFNLNQIDLSQKIELITIDSRNIKPGSIFVALKGEHHDGHDYLAQAKSAGAILSVVNKIDKNIALPQILVADVIKALGLITKYLDQIWPKVKISITGSSGKTTTKFMLEKILATKGEVLCAQSSFNNNIGVPLTIFQASEQQWAGIFEIGTNHAGEIDYLTRLINADIAVLTNISVAHIGNFKSLDDIALEKSAIFNGLKSNGVAIIHYESEYKEFLLNQIENLNKSSHKQIKTYTFGYSSEADISASNIQANANNTIFKLNYKNKSLEIKLKLLGKHQVLNALAAALAAAHTGIDLPQIKLGLEAVKPVYKRMEAKSLSEKLTIIDDSYNANPKSVGAALEFLAEIPGKKILVLGDMRELGDLSNFEHQQIGRLARSLKIDKLYAFGEYAQLAMQIFDNNQNKFADKQDLVNTLINDISDENNLGNSNHCTVLLKGSNSTKMWEVGEKLQTIFTK